MDNRYNRHNRRKYSLKVHIVLVTKYRKQLLRGSITDDVKQKIYDICNSKGYGVIAMETDKERPYTFSYQLRYYGQSLRHCKTNQTADYLLSVAKISKLPV